MSRRSVRVARSAVMMVLAMGAAVALPIAPATAAPTCLQSAADEASARATAARCRSRVEIVAARSERGQAFANPDATFTMESFARPQRMRRPDGTWVNLDPSLRRAGGRLVPVAALSHATFGEGGASGPLVSVTSGPHALTLSWPGRLPAPSVSEGTATYANVLSDVDLVIRSTSSGFKHVLVVRSAAAAANPALARVAYPSGGDAGVTVAANGKVTAKAPDGSVLATAAPAAMWDSSTEPVSVARAGLASANPFVG